MTKDQPKIDHVINMRAARDTVILDLLDKRDPDSVRKASAATDFWLEAEGTLNAEEFAEYVTQWRARP